MSAFNVETSDGVSTIVADCDLDTEECAKELISTVNGLVDGAEPKSIVLDLSRVQLINSYVIGKLLLLNNKLNNLNIAFKIKKPSKFVSDTLSLLLLDDILTIER